jgi:hypothetical protein
MRARRPAQSRISLRLRPDGPERLAACKAVCRRCHANLMGTEAALIVPTPDSLPAALAQRSLCPGSIATRQRIHTGLSGTIVELVDTPQLELPDLQNATPMP